VADGVSACAKAPEESGRAAPKTLAMATPLLPRLKKLRRFIHEVISSPSVKQANPKTGQRLSDALFDWILTSLRQMPISVLGPEI
jgi:hypothetical protein